MNRHLERIAGDSLLEYLQAEPKATVRSSPCSPLACQAPRHSASRPQSPKGPERCCLRMASPSARVKGKVEALEKQLAQWRERGQVWAKEKQTLERKLGLQTFESTPKEGENDFIRRAKDLLILRQESRLKEQAGQLQQLQACLHAGTGTRLEDLKATNLRLGQQVKALEAELTELRGGLSVPATGATTPEDLTRPILVDFKGNRCQADQKDQKSLVSDLCHRLRHVEAELSILTEAFSRTQSSEISLKQQLQDLEKAFQLRDMEAQQATKEKEELQRLYEELKRSSDREKWKTQEIVAKLDETTREKDAEMAEKQGKEAELEGIRAELADVRQVLGASETEGLGNVDVRGLARILLASVCPT